MRGLDRRRFLAQGGGALFQVLAGRAVSHAEPARHVPRFRVPLPIPAVLSPVRADATTDYYELEQREAWVEIVPGLRTRVRGYDGAFPGPTIRARRGRTTVVTHTND